MLWLVLYGRLLSVSLFFPPSLAPFLALLKQQETGEEEEAGKKTTSALIFPLSPSTFSSGIPKTSLMSLLSFISQQKEE